MLEDVIENILIALGLDTEVEFHIYAKEDSTIEEKKKYFRNILLDGAKRKIKEISRVPDKD